MTTSAAESRGKAQLASAMEAAHQSAEARIAEERAKAGSRFREWLKDFADPASHGERPPLTSDSRFAEIMRELVEADRRAQERQEGPDDEQKKHDGDDSPRRDGKPSEERPTKSDSERSGHEQPSEGSAADPASREERTNGRGKEHDGSEPPQRDAGRPGARPTEAGSEQSGPEQSGAGSAADPASREERSGGSE